MKITFKKGLLAAIAALTVCSARADEGMWLLQLMKQQNSIDMMKKQGLKLDKFTQMESAMTKLNSTQSSISSYFS